MTHTLSPELRHNGTVTKRPIGAGLTCAFALRAACAMLADADPGQIPSTTVVAARQGATARELRTLVATLAEEFGLDASLEVQDGSFIARFRRRAGERSGQGA